MPEHLPEFHREIEVPAPVSLERDYLPESARVHFHFALHLNQEDFEGARQLFVDSDIYVPEAVGWNEKFLKLYRATSKGDRKAFSKMQASIEGGGCEGFEHAQLEAIRGTYKPILLIDAAEHETDPRLGDKTTPRRILKAKSYDEALQITADDAAWTAEESLKRDSLMVQNLGVKASELISAHPKLKDRDEVKILCVLGAGHAAVYSTLADSESVANKIERSGVNIAEEDVTSLHGSSYAVFNYQEGNSPTRATIAHSLTDFAFLVAQNEEVIRRTGIDTTFIPQPFSQLGITTVRMLAEDNLVPETQQAVLHLAQAKITAEDRALLAQYIDRAQQESAA